MTQGAIKLGTRARVTPAKLDVERLLDLAKASAPDPSIFDTVNPFFWDVRASSNRLDYYSTRMRAGRGKTLDNFVRGLKDGVSYQDSHNTYKLGWGHSLDGRLVTTDETDEEIEQKIVEAWGTFFTLPDQTFAGQDTNSFINAVRSGVWRDVSVGFAASDIECGLCGKQSFEWWKDDGCPHLPGLDYELATGDGGTITRTAWAWINDGELLEVSQVYEGASPAAAVVKAEQMSAEGRLTEMDRARVERRFSTRIATPERRFALGAVPGERRGVMPDKDKNQRGSEEQDETVDPVEQVADETVIAPLEDDEESRTTEADAELEGTAQVEAELLTTEEGQLDVLSEERARFAPHGITLGRSPVKAVRALGDEVVRLRAALAQERTLANIGRRYKDDLIEDTITEGVRALGKDFRADQYRAILGQLDIDGIRLMRDDFAARATFPTERITKEDAEHEGPATRRVEDDDPERFRS